MAKVNFKEVEILQWDTTMKVCDIREEALPPMSIHQKKEIVMLGQRLYQGEVELNEQEEQLLRQLIAHWPWVTRDAIERQLAKQ